MVQLSHPRIYFNILSSYSQIGYKRTWSVNLKHGVTYFKPLYYKPLASSAGIGRLQWLRFISQILDLKIKPTVDDLCKYPTKEEDVTSFREKMIITSHLPGKLMAGSPENFAVAVSSATPAPMNKANDVSGSSYSSRRMEHSKMDPVSWNGFVRKHGGKESGGRAT